MSAPPRRPRQVKLKEDDEATSSRENSGERVTQTLSVSPPENSSPPIERTDAHSAFSAQAIKTNQEPSLQKTSSPNSPKADFPASDVPEQPPLKSAEIREKSNDSIERTIVQTRSEAVLPKIEAKKPPPKIFAPPDVEARTSIVVKPRVEKTVNRIAETAIHQPISPARGEKIPVQTSDRAMPPESPTINVTIGRVEIRAVVSSSNINTSVGAKSAKPPMMSLEDYLQKQNAGGKR